MAYTLPNLQELLHAEGDRAAARASLSGETSIQAGAANAQRLAQRDHSTTATDRYHV
jgi:hypothetical protein